jgi:hypothetical protein
MAVVSARRAGLILGASCYRRRVLLLFVTLTLTATYPIATAPSRYAYFDHPDAQLNMWIMAWDARALVHHPRALFDANIFYPAHDTLAYSETLLGYSPLFGPVLWLGGTPALAFNVVLLFSFVASGLFMYLLVRHLTGRQWPSIVAGIVYAFVPYRFVHVPQIQLLAMEWFPLVFLFLHRFVELGALRHAIGLGAAFVIGTLCCVYYGVFLTAALVVGGLTLAALDQRARRPRTLGGLVMVALAAGLLMAPVANAYMRVHERDGLRHSTEEISARSADVRAYTASTAPLHRALHSPVAPPPRDFLFPGGLALVLASIGVAGAGKRTVAVYAAVGTLGVLASFGPHGVMGVSAYGFLYRVFPVLQGLRQLSRFGVLELFAVAVLAGLGAAALEAWMGSARARVWMAVLALLVFVESFQAPLRYDRPNGRRLAVVPQTPRVYTWLAQQPGSFASLELPLPRVGELYRNAPYVYWSTTHWHPLVNGYSGFAARDYPDLRLSLRRFPDERSRAELVSRHVRYVIVHRDLYRPFDRPQGYKRRLQRTAWLKLIASEGAIDVYEVAAG